MVFYSSNVIFGYYVLKDCNFLPPQLGGSGSFANIFKDGNMDSTFEKPPFFKLYYMIYLSHNLTDMIYLLFIYEKQTDFPLMFFHHSCTISLIFFSHYTNHSHIGAIVMIVHDLADILVYNIRTTINTDVPMIVTLISVFALFFMYLYSRIYVFALLIKTCYEYQSDWNVMFSTLWYFMCFLYTIHIWWLKEIAKKIFMYFFKNEVSDTQSFQKQVKQTQ